MNIKAISVIEIDCGTPHNINSFDNFEDAAKLFKSIVISVYEESECTPSDKELENMVDDGVFNIDEYSVYLMSS